MKKSRGIVMIVSLFSLAAVTMLVGAATMLMPTELFASRHAGDTNQALFAASSGVDYAQSRLQANPLWRGNNDGVTMGLVVNRPDFQVFEDNGNVIGVLVASDGSRSAFRMRFNFQNAGEAPDEGLADPASSNHLVFMSRVSVNNLEGVGDALTYTAANSGTWRVPLDATATGAVPRGFAELIVEGLGGAGLASATVDNLNTVTANNREIYGQTIQCRVGIGALTRVDTAMAAGNDLDADINGGAGNLTLSAANGTPPPKVRSLSNITVNAMTDISANGKAIVDQSVGTITGIPIANRADESIAQQTDRFLRLSWDQVPKATTSDTQLKAGTYVWRPDGGSHKLFYYEENYSGTIPTGAGTPIDATTDMIAFGDSTDISLDPLNLRTVVSDKVFVAPNLAGTVTDLAILVDPAITAASRKRANIIMQSGDIGLNDAILTTPGNLYVDGSTEGYGAITSEKNVTFQGSSVIESDPEGSIALYSKGNVTINAIPQAVADQVEADYGLDPGMGMSSMGSTHGNFPGGLNPMGMSMSMAMGMSIDEPPPFVLSGSDISFAGLVYTQNNFVVNTTAGNFFMRGILTAFGGDPANSEPGSTPSAGVIEIKAKNSRVIYDPSYLQQLIESGEPIRLERVTWNLL